MATDRDNGTSFILGTLKDSGSGRNETIVSTNARPGTHRQTYLIQRGQGVQSLKVIDLFCGTGGFSKGFENQGSYKVVFGIDLLEQSIETFKLNHQSAIAITGDIRTVRRSEVSERLKLGRGEIDVIIGGPPCQGFSSIRPFRSVNDDDPRNNLFEEFAAYVNYFRPKYLLFENVVGLATHKGGSSIEGIAHAFASLGYEVDWRILNAAHFGIPQKRERLIVLGALSGIPINFPTPTHGGEFKTIGHVTRERMLSPPSRNGSPTLLSDRHTIRLPPALTVDDAIGDLPIIESGEEAIYYDRPPQNAYQAARRKGKKELTLHSSTRHTNRMLNIIRHSGPNIHSIPKHLISSGFSSCYSRLAGQEPAVTITVNFVHPASNRCIHPHSDRALTPREGARLQSFDDDFAFAGNRTQITKQIGNAVPPLLGQALAGPIADALGDTGY